MARSGQAVRGRYRMKEHGQTTSRGLQGMYVLKEGAGCQIWKPTWHRTRTVFRPFPALDPDDPTQWDPFRFSDEQRDTGDWIRKLDAVTIGSPGITFVLMDERDKSTTDIQQNPAWIIYRELTAAVKSGQHPSSWNPYIFGATGRRAPISSPGEIYLMQGVLMEHKSTSLNPPRGLAADDDTVVIMLSSKAGESLLDDWLMRTDEAGNFLYPDICRLDAGNYIDIHEEGTPVPGIGAGVVAQPAQSLTDMAAAGGQRGGGGRGSDIHGYEVALLPDYNGIGPALDPGLVCPKLKRWDDIVRIPSIEEQVCMICGAGLPADAVLFALGDAYREFIPDHILEQVRGMHAQTQGASFPPPDGSAPAGFVSAGPVADPSMPAVGDQPIAAGPVASPAAAAPPVGPAPAVAPVATTVPLAAAGSPLAAPPAPAANPQVATAIPPAGPPQATPAAAVAAAPAPVATAPAANPTAPAAQPTHAAPARAAATEEALARARSRARNP